MRWNACFFNLIFSHNCLCICVGSVGKVQANYIRRQGIRCKTKSPSRGESFLRFQDFSFFACCTAGFCCTSSIQRLFITMADEVTKTTQACHDP